MTEDKLILIFWATVILVIFFGWLYKIYDEHKAMKK